MAQVGRIIPGTEENDPVQAAERSPAAQARGDALRAELRNLNLELGDLETDGNTLRTQLDQRNI